MSDDLKKIDNLLMSGLINNLTIRSYSNPRCLNLTVELDSGYDAHRFLRPKLIHTVVVWDLDPATEHQGIRHKRNNNGQLYLCIPRKKNESLQSWLARSIAQMFLEFTEVVETARSDCLRILESLQEMQNLVSDGKTA